MPAHRVDFFDEQARRRRGALGLSAACLGIAAVIGAILSTVMGPLTMAAAVLVLRLLGPVVPAAERLRVGLAHWVEGGSAAFFTLADSIASVHGPADLVPLAPLLGRAASLLVPSMLGAALVWLWASRLIGRGDTEAATLRLGAREARANDAEERQFVNVVAEMALAAGLPSPSVRVIDSARVNAAVVGASHRHATLIVTRGLLDALDREETLGVVAHLVGAAGGGQLRVAAALRAVFVTLGGGLTLFDLPFRRGAWTAFRDAARCLLGRASGTAVNRVVDGLTVSLTPDSSDTMLRVLSLAERAPPFGALLILPLLPFALVAIMQKLIVQMWMLFVLNWPLAALWRTRRLLADAVAVQLTRDPDGLVRALRRIDGEDDLPEGAAMHELAFIHVPAAARAGLRERFFITARLGPAIGRRIARLEAQGAGAAPATSGVRTRAAPLWRLARERPLAFAVVVLLGGVVLPLVVVLAVLVGALTLFTVMISAALGVALMNEAVQL